MVKKILKNQLPKNSKIISVNVSFDNDFVYTELELEEAFAPKNGDYLVDKDGYIFILDNKFINTGVACAYCYMMPMFDNTYKMYDTPLDNITLIKNCRYATKDEIEDFDNKLNEIFGMMWNKKNKSLTTYRKRQILNNYYTYINFSDFSIHRAIDTYSEEDDIRFYNGNYFDSALKALNTLQEIKQKLI